MIKRLRSLFDFQQFENNPRLKAMLDDALERYDFSEEGELSDNDAGLLNAAGMIAADPYHDKEKRT